MIDTQQKAWAIGLFEGEGSIIFTRGRSVILSVQMTDKDVVERLYKIFGKGHLTGPYKVKGDSKKEYKTTWKWGVFKGSEVAELLTEWLPLLSERRKLKALEALERLKDLGKRKPRDLFCRLRGHPWTIENTYTSPKRKFRMCKACRKIKLDEQKVSLGGRL